MLPVFIIEVSFMELANEIFKFLFYSLVVNLCITGLLFRSKIIGIKNSWIIESFHFSFSRGRTYRNTKVRKGYDSLLLRKWSLAGNPTQCCQFYFFTSSIAVEPLLLLQSHLSSNSSGELSTNSIFLIVYLTFLITAMSKRIQKLFNSLNSVFAWRTRRRTFTPTSV